MKFKYFFISINGKRWRYRLLPPDAYIALHGETSYAITDTSKKLVDFHATELDIVKVRHELIHVYSDGLYLTSAGINQEQTEEIFAEMISHNWETMNDQAKQMFDKLSKVKESMGAV